MWHVVLLCILCFIFRNFWAIYEFSYFYLIYFWFLVVTCSYESLECIHDSFEFFEFLYEQWSQIKVGIEKVGKILGCLKFGTADSPRVMGGQSAVHETCSPEALQRSSQPQNYTADGPPKDRGRSASHRFIRQASDTPVVCHWARSGRSGIGPRTVRQCWEEFAKGSFSRVSV